MVHWESYYSASVVKQKWYQQQSVHSVCCLVDE